MTYCCIPLFLFLFFLFPFSLFPISYHLIGTACLRCVKSRQVYCCCIPHTTCFFFLSFFFHVPFTLHCFTTLSGVDMTYWWMLNKTFSFISLFYCSNFQFFHFSLLLYFYHFRDLLLRDHYLQWDVLKPFPVIFIVLTYDITYLKQIITFFIHYDNFSNATKLLSIKAGQGKSGILIKSPTALFFILKNLKKKFSRLFIIEMW